jgi:SET domain-containing protein
MNSYFKDTKTSKGRGMFAKRSFVNGDIVEECPVVLFNEVPALPVEIKRIMFSWHYLLTGSHSAQAIALGFGSMYNHNNPANMRYDIQKVLRFFAVRDIGVDEELTINYNAHGGGAEWKKNEWFERMNVTPLIEPHRP